MNSKTRIVVLHMKEIIYTSTLTLNNTDLEVDVTVDEIHINSIRFSNLDETITTMYPLIQPALEDLAEQIYEKQSTASVEIPAENPYTSRAILDSICTALEKAASPEE